MIRALVARLAVPGEGVSLGTRVRAGLGWSFVNTIVARAGTFVSGIVLARLLAPDDFGVYAVALVALSALISMNELGVSLAVVRWPGDVRRIAPTVTTISIASSTGLYVVMVLLAPVLADLLGAPEASGVIRLLCVGVLIDGLVATPAAAMQREFQQDRRMAADLANFAVGTGLTVLLAVLGVGAWSLAWGRVAGGLVSAVLLVRLAPIPLRVGFDRCEARALLRFGLPLAGSSFVLFAVMNVDYVVLGHVLGPTALGLYLLAFNLSSWPVNVFSTVARSVSLAGFAKLQDRPDVLRQRFARSLSLLVALALPVCVLLSVLAGPTIRIVYGSQWSQAAVALEYLALLGLVRVALELAYDVLVAVGASATVMRLQVLWLATLAPAVYVGARWGGLQGVGAAHAAVAAAVVVPAYLLALHRLGITVGALARQLRLPAFGAVMLAGVAVCCRMALTGDLTTVLVAGPAGGLAYLAVVHRMRHTAPEPVVEGEALAAATA